MKKLLLLIFTFFSLKTFATLIVPTLTPGNTYQNTLLQPMTAKVFDRATGTFFAGLNRGGGNFSVCSAQRPVATLNSFFAPLGNIPPLSDGPQVRYLALATSTGNTNPNLGIVIQPLNPSVLPQPIKVLATNKTGSILTQSAPINDASGATNNNGSTTSGIVGLAANQLYLFPAVRPCGGDFGSECNGGIASVAINPSNLGLTQVPAVPNDSGIKAIALDPTTPQVLINNSPSIVANTVDMFWDDYLQRLYIGIQLTTAGDSSSGATCLAGTGPCITGNFLTCATGFKPDLAIGGCVTCPSGGIYNPNFQQCVPCPTGQAFDPSVYACVSVPCLTGSFFSPASGCVTCPSGYNFNTGTNTCVTCPNGGYYNFSIPGCTACPNGGTFDPAQGICLPGPIICTPPAVYDPIHNTCIIPPFTCPPGYTFDVINITCVAIQPGPSGPSGLQASSEILPLLNGPRPPKFLYNSSAQNYVGPNGLRSPQPITEQNLASRTPVESGGRSVVVASVNDSGQITFANIAPDSAFVTGDQTRMVGVVDDVADSLSINKVRVMHASTGPSYLIINGGNGTAIQTGNLFYALPLVDLGDPTNAAQGTLADVNSALVDYKFVVQATSNSELAASTDPAAMIGGGPLGIPASSSISDIDVIGDTVYVSINQSPTGATEGGLLYSQALFDQTGKIIRWTPWTKKAFPVFSTESQVNTSAITFFAVDAKISTTWIVDTQKTTVLQTAWEDFSENPLALINQINNTQTGITGASTAVLDLDQSTRGFLSNENLSRYALFAGDSNGQPAVIFARISQAYTNTINSPQMVFTNFTLPTNFLITQLPTQTCQINVLEYARQLTGASTNYFFAGTIMGLYVFADGGNGFDVNTMGSLNTAPFTTSSWEQAPNIPAGSVIDVKTSGNVLYVLVQNSITQSTLLSIPFASTMAGMFAPSNITVLAQTGAAPFGSIITLNGIQIIATQPDGSTEQLVLATNNGLYQSARVGGVQAATSAADANWQLIAGTNSYYAGIARMDNASIPVASPSTVWPFYLADTCSLQIFEQSVLQQLNGSSDSTPFAFVPLLFNSIDAATDPNFTAIPLISYFWSDGARRISVVENIQSSCAPTQLLSLPFNTVQWNIPSPNDALLNDPWLNDRTAFYWVMQIGVSGSLYAGTEKGVLALE